MANTITTSTRRGFLKALAALAGAAWVMPGAGAATGEKPSKVGSIIDTHTHFYDPTRPQGVPWPGKDDKLLYRRVLPADLKAVAQPHNVMGTVVVEASPWVEDNQWLLNLATKDPFIVGVVGNLAPGSDEYRKHLERFARNQSFRGIRISQQQLRQGLDQARFREDLQMLAGKDLELDVNGGPDMPADVARLAMRLPELRVVINHAANVPIDGKGVQAGWREGMQAAARQANVYCKVSALVEGTGRRDGMAPKEMQFYKPVLDVLWETFGEDRLIYGSNWPVSERFADYGTMLGIVRDYFQARGKTAADKFFRRNALAAYKWVQR